MSSLKTDDLRTSYARMRDRFLGTHPLRECERDAMGLYELETDWAGLRDRLMLGGVSATGAELDSHMLMRVKEVARRARESMSLISNERYRDMCEELSPSSDGDAPSVN